MVKEVGLGVRDAIVDLFDSGLVSDVYLVDGMLEVSLENNRIRILKEDVWVKYKWRSYL